LTTDKKKADGEKTFGEDYDESHDDMNLSRVYAVIWQKLCAFTLIGLDKRPLRLYKSFTFLKIIF
jgi:hypothetical protein